MTTHRILWCTASKAYAAAPECTELRSKGNIVVRLAWLEPLLGAKALTAIDRACIVATLDAKRAEGAAEATLNRYASTISCVLRFASDRGWIDRPPLMPHYMEAKRPESLLDGDHAARLILALPYHLKPLVRFSLSTGLRQSNVTGLEWHRVSFAKRHLYIDALDAKAGKAIGIPLSDEALEILNEQKGKHETLVFPNKRGKRFGNPAGAAWKRAVREAGLRDFRWHDLRHTWASRHAMMGTPLPVLQRLGGWSNLDMVMRYAHFSPDFTAQYANNSRVVVVSQ